MKIGIDLDNVLNNLTEEWINAYNEHENKDIKLSDITNYNMTSNKGIDNNVFKYLNDSVTVHLKPLPNAIVSTLELAKRHELFIITATYPENMAVKMTWLQHYFPHIPRRNIIVTSRKELVNVDVLIDDVPENVYNFGMWDRVIVFDQPWNQSVEEYIPRAKDWNEVLERIEELEVYIG